jgi:hypothetical protein
MTKETLSNREILKNAYIKNTNVSFLYLSNLSNAETNVKIVKLQNEDVSNLEFTFQTKKGEKFTSFENNIMFI